MVNSEIPIDYTASPNFHAATPQLTINHEATLDLDSSNAFEGMVTKDSNELCYMDFDPDNSEIVWCKASCGNNMHKDCFDQWAASQKGKEIRCVYCRSPWQKDTGDLSTQT